jgi:uncharacterized protein
MTRRSAMPGFLLAAYKRFLSPMLHAVSGVGGGCRFQPTCSEYAAIAFHEHGFLRGAWLTLARVLKCHPLHAGGFDPVPAREFAAGSALKQSCTGAVTMEESHLRRDSRI